MMDHSPLPGNRNYRFKSERGAALIIVMIMLLLLMILGATLLTSSTTELRIAGNYRNTEEAFYAADALIESLYTGILRGETSSISELVRPNGVPFVRTVPVPSGSGTATYTVTYAKPGSARTLMGSGFGDEHVDATSVYVMEVTGYDSNNNASVELEAAFALIEP